MKTIPQHFTICLVTMLVIACASCNTSNAEVSSQPNILFLFADDWGMYASCFADEAHPGPNDIIKTPGFDRLAEGGLLFRNAFTNAPSCTPSRAALATGNHFFNCGTYVNLHGIPDEEEIARFTSLPQFPALLDSAGYHVGMAYKTLRMESLPGSHNYSQFGLPEGCCHFSERTMEAEDMKAKGEAIFAAVRKDFEACISKADELGQPFFFMSGPHNTHRPWVRGFGKAYWGIEPDDLKGKLPAYMPDVPEIREDLADYLGECQVSDRYMLEYMAILGEKGLLDNTLIIATGDNGIPGFPRGKMNCYNPGIQQGMLVHWPAGISSKGLKLQDFISFIDLAPTFCEVAGLAVPEEMTGRSMLPLFAAKKSGQADPSRDHVIAGRERHDMNAREGNLPYPTRVWRDKDYLFLINFKPERWPNTALPDLAHGDTDQGPTVDYYKTITKDPAFREYIQKSYGKRPRLELYDIHKDPDCMVNLAEDPAFDKLVQDYEKKILNRLTELGDRRVTGDGSTFDNPPFTLPYTMLYNAK